MNPTTGYPAQTDIASVSVISEDCYRADALATALMVMGSAKASEFCKLNKINAAIIVPAEEDGLKTIFTHKFESFVVD